MTLAEARKLATQIARESNGVVVKFGTTNGTPRLHLINAKLRKSLTIKSPVEWIYHEWNKFNQPKEPVVAS